MSPRETMSRARLVAVGSIALVPWIVLALQVRRYGVNVPFSDQWEFPLLIQELRRGALDSGDFFAQHNEQRMFFPRLVMMGLAVATSWNIKVEMLVSLGLGLVIFAVTFALMLKTMRPLRGWVAVPVIVASGALSSLSQWENWFWGWQISWFLPLACLFLAVGFLTLWPENRTAWPPVLLAASAAWVGQYSLLSGSMIWLVCLPLLVARRSFRRWIGPWLGVAATSTFVYLRNYRSASNMEFMHATPQELVEEPGRAVEYLLYLVGRPVLDMDPQIWVGLTVLALLVAAVLGLVAFRRRRLDDALPWLAIAAYAVATALGTMFGRLNLGVGQAGSSRYSTVGIVLMVSTLALVGLAILPERRAAVGLPRIGAVLLPWILLAGLFVVDYESEFDQMYEWHLQRHRIRECLLTAENAGDPCLIEAYPSPPAVLERARFLQRIGWGGLSE